MKDCVLGVLAHFFEELADAFMLGAQLVSSDSGARGKEGDTFGENS